MSQLAVSVVLAIVVLVGMLTAVAYCIYFERKISAWIQDRIGPNRAGPLGLLQPIADGVKFLMKEDPIPGHVDRVLFVFAPAIIFVVAFIGFAAIPWGGRVQIGDRLFDIQVATPDIGLLYILGVASMGVYGVVLGGWASNNKYSFYGAMRATAQMISYEIPMGLCIIVVVLTTGTLRLEDIARTQAGSWLGGLIPQWNVFLHPVAFLVLFITALAESNRAPFDLAEAEQELVGGYHTEYGALKFGMFFLAEYAHMITASALIAVLFLGGYHLPWIPWAQPEATSIFAAVFKVLVVCGKIAGFIFVMMWIRWTLPRFRFDQLLRLAWKGLVPMSLGLFVLAVVLLYVGQQRNFVLALGGNAAIVVVTLLVAARGRTEITGRQRNMPPVTRASLRGTPASV
jgi:NADH-quinone oxidoreductase subunit H